MKVPFDGGHYASARWWLDKIHRLSNLWLTSTTNVQSLPISRNPLQQGLRCAPVWIFFCCCDTPYATTATTLCNSTMLSSTLCNETPVCSLILTFFYHCNMPYVVTTGTCCRLCEGCRCGNVVPTGNTYMWGYDNERTITLHPAAAHAVDTTHGTVGWALVFSLFDPENLHVKIGNTTSYRKFIASLKPLEKRTSTPLYENIRCFFV